MPVKFRLPRLVTRVKRDPNLRAKVFLLRPRVRLKNRESLSRASYEDKKIQHIWPQNTAFNPCTSADQETILFPDPISRPHWRIEYEMSSLRERHDLQEILWTSSGTFLRLEMPLMRRDRRRCPSRESKIDKTRSGEKPKKYKAIKNVGPVRRASSRDPEIDWDSNS